MACGEVCLHLTLDNIYTQNNVPVFLAVFMQLDYACIHCEWVQLYYRWTPL